MSKRRPRAGAGRSGRGPGDRVAPGARSLTDYVYLVPALVLVVGLIYFSIGYTAWLSTQDWNGFSPNRVGVGVANYRAALEDHVFWRSLVNVVGFIVLGLVQMLTGLALALLLHGQVRLGLVYRVCFFLPVVIAPAAIAPIYRELLSPSGQINTLMEHIGLGALSHAWLADPKTAIYALGAIGFCSGAGFCFVLYYAALTQLDTEMLEAARVDGAGNVRTFVSIIVPALRATHLTLIILITIFTIKVFDLPQIITSGGPANSTQFPATHIYQAGVTDYEAGYGAALTVVLVVLCTTVAGWQLWLARRSESEA
ncbi:carbohydrate ABC transporter permease [Actinomadura sp. WMMA1423]|uniref:carbohydrate ABC transporter permease n=1 Tax=Actinomadura sp. WMMA1423 TaxID=2591108 RepID=UPI001146B3FB|nr:sugar ABC transporter permease [Actinomadura sp. WMMA1423]